MSTDVPRSPVSPDRALRRVLTFFVLIFVVLTGVVVASLINLNRSIATSDWVNHTHALISELDSLQPTLAAAEIGLSKFALSGDPRDQERAQNHFAQLAESVAVINALVSESPEEKPAFATIAAALDRRAERAKLLIQHKKANNAAAVLKLLDDDAATTEQRDLETSIDRLRQRQAELLNARDRAAHEQAQTTRWTVLVGLTLDLLLLAGAAWLIRDDLAARRRAAQLLQQTNEQLEEKVSARTAELAASNAQLLNKNLEDRWAKQAIEHQNRYNLLIIDSIADGVFVVTKLMHVSRMNPSAIKVTGYAPADLVDHPLSRVVRLTGPEYAPANSTYDPLTRTLVDGHELRDQPAVVLAKNGQNTPIRLSVYPLRDRDKVVGGVVTFQLNASSS